MRKVGGTSIGVVLGLVIVASGLVFVYAQAPGGGPGGGGQGMRGGFTLERMQQMMLDRVKEELKPTDEEWKAMEPLVAPVVEKQMEMRMSSFRRMGRGGQRSGRTGMEQNVDPAVKGLEDALASADTPAKDIAAKLKALRESRKAKEEALKKAQDKLREVLSIRQEAQLVLMDIIK